jgi:type IV secretion system protein VirB10
MIQAVLETAIDSQLAGPVRALVSEDVHAYDGSRVLIPRGSRLIGRYQSGVDIAQQRITIAWDRVILPDSQTVEISAFGGDALGRSGTTGFVDSRFGTRFGSAALISLIGTLPSMAAESTDDERTAEALEGTAESLQDSAQSVIGEYLALSPVIYVDQGARVTVMVDRDLEIF